MGGSPTLQQAETMQPMMRKEIMEEVKLPDGSTYIGGGDLPYYGDKYPMAVPSNGKEPLRNMEYIKQEKAIKESVKNLPEYMAVTPPPKPAGKSIANEGPFLNSPTADYPDVRGNTQNSQGRDTSVSEYMKAKTYKKQERPLNAPTADWPDERK
jgi:hypothetical protein